MVELLNDSDHIRVSILYIKGFYSFGAVYEHAVDSRCEDHL